MLQAVYGSLSNFFSHFCTDITRQNKDVCLLNSKEGFTGYYQNLFSAWGLTAELSHCTVDSSSLRLSTFLHLLSSLHLTTVTEM